MAFLKEGGEQSQQDRKKRDKIMEKYKKDAASMKLKGSIAHREQMRTKADVIKETGSYSIRFLFLKVPTGDEILY